MTIPAELSAVMPKYGITSPLRKAHFLAQMAHETGGFQKFVENLNYSAERLRIIFPKYFHDAKFAASYVGKPQAIANRVYGNRFGNGPESSGDGFKYRGRGFTHLTFKDNYAQASENVFGDDRLVRDPDLAATLPVAAEIAGWYWQSRKCNVHADRDELESVTRAINGGVNGLQQRRDWLKHFKKELGL